MDPLRWPVGSWGPPPPPEPVQALAVACGKNFCDRRVAAGFGNAIRENYYTHGRCKRLRWPVRFAEERDAGMGGPKVNLTFNPLAKLHPAEAPGGGGALGRAPWAGLSGGGQFSKNSGEFY